MCNKMLSEEATKKGTNLSTSGFKSKIQLLAHAKLIKQNDQ